MTEADFRRFLGRSESETLDFKEDGYDLKNSREAFIKDVLAMANTPRDHAAHIVFGVRWTPESGTTVIGLTRQLDDALLQDAFGPGRVQPVPRFTYSPLEFQGKHVGVLEIPVNNDGPYSPLKDFDKLTAGVFYCRRGTQNYRATGPDAVRILTWFQDGNLGTPTDPPNYSWPQLVQAIHGFEQGRNYLLAVDRIPSTTSAAAYALGMVPWRAVIDFDPDSETSGLLSSVAATLGRHRVIHKVVRGQYAVQPEPGTHWFFARGLSGRSETLATGRHTTWLKTYKQELSRQLEKLAAALSPSPTTVLVLWSDTRMRNHLRTLLEELHGALGDTVTAAIVASEEAPVSDLAEAADASLFTMSLRSLCNGLAVHYADMSTHDAERHVLPSSSGAPVEVDTNDWLWLREDLDLVHRSTGLVGNDDATEYRLGADVSWRNLHLRHDCDRDISPMVRSQVEADLLKRQTVRINLYHAPGSGGTTVARRSHGTYTTLPRSRFSRGAPPATLRSELPRSPH